MFSTKAVGLTEAFARGAVSTILTLQKIRTLAKCEGRWGPDKTKEILETQLQLAIRDGDANAIGIFANQLVESDLLDTDQVLNLIIDNMQLAIDTAIKNKDTGRRKSSLRFSFGGLIDPPIEEKDFIGSAGGKRSLIQARLEDSSTQTVGNGLFSALFLRRKAASGEMRGKDARWLDSHGWPILQGYSPVNVEHALLKDLELRSRIFPT